MNEWKAELDKFKAQASGISTAQLEIHEELKPLEAKITDGEARLAELAETSDEAWDALKEDMMSAWDSITAAFSEAADKLKK